MNLIKHINLYFWMALNPKHPQTIKIKQLNAKLRSVRHDAFRLRCTIFLRKTQTFFLRIRIWVLKMRLRQYGQPKPSDTMDGNPCPICNMGEFRDVQIDHVVSFPNAPGLIVFDVWVEKCTACNEIVFPPESSRYIENAIYDDQQSGVVRTYESYLKKLKVLRPGTSMMDGPDRRKTVQAEIERVEKMLETIA